MYASNQASLVILCIKCFNVNFCIVIIVIFVLNLFLKENRPYFHKGRCLIEKRGYTQLIKQYTTDYRSLIDHIYTNIPHFVQSSGVLESYFSDHKPLFISWKT